MLELPAAQIRALRRKAHHLKPVVLIGQHGLTDNVMKEIDCALESHELIKIRITGSDKAERQTQIEHICEKQQAAFIKTIGYIAVIYRKQTKKK